MEAQKIKIKNLRKEKNRQEIESRKRPLELLQWIHSISLRRHNNKSFILLRNSVEIFSIFLIFFFSNFLFFVLEVIPYLICLLSAFFQIIPGFYYFNKFSLIFESKILPQSLKLISVAFNYLYHYEFWIFFLCIVVCVLLATQFLQDFILYFIDAYFGFDILIYTSLMDDIYGDLLTTPTAVEFIKKKKKKNFFFYTSEHLLSYNIFDTDDDIDFTIDHQYVERISENVILNRFRADSSHYSSTNLNFFASYCTIIVLFLMCCFTPSIFVHIYLGLWIFFLQYHWELVDYYQLIQSGFILNSHHDRKYENEILSIKSEKKKIFSSNRSVSNFQNNFDSVLIQNIDFEAFLEKKNKNLIFDVMYEDDEVVSTDYLEPDDFDNRDYPRYRNYTKRKRKWRTKRQLFKICEKNPDFKRDFYDEINYRLNGENKFLTGEELLFDTDFLFELILEKKERYAERNEWRRVYNHLKPKKLTDFRYLLPRKYIFNTHKTFQFKFLTDFLYYVRTDDMGSTGLYGDRVDYFEKILHEQLGSDEELYESFYGIPLKEADKSEQDNFFEKKTKALLSKEDLAWEEIVAFAEKLVALDGFSDYIDYNTKEQIIFFDFFSYKLKNWILQCFYIIDLRQVIVKNMYTFFLLKIKFFFDKYIIYFLFRILYFLKLFHDQIIILVFIFSKKLFFRTSTRILSKELFYSQQIFYKFELLIKHFCLFIYFFLIKLADLNFIKIYDFFFKLLLICLEFITKKKLINFFFVKPIHLFEIFSNYSDFNNFIFTKQYQNLWIDMEDQVTEEEEEAIECFGEVELLFEDEHDIRNTITELYESFIHYFHQYLLCLFSTVFFFFFLMFSNNYINNCLIFTPDFLISFDGNDIKKPIFYYLFYLINDFINTSDTDLQVIPAYILNHSFMLSDLFRYELYVFENWALTKPFFDFLLKDDSGWEKYWWFYADEFNSEVEDYFVAYTYSELEEFVFRTAYKINLFPELNDYEMEFFAIDDGVTSDYSDYWYGYESNMRDLFEEYGYSLLDVNRQEQDFMLKHHSLISLEYEHETIYHKIPRLFARYDEDHQLVFKEEDFEEIEKKFLRTLLWERYSNGFIKINIDLFIEKCKNMIKLEYYNTIFFFKFEVKPFLLNILDPIKNRFFKL